jgi:hypothetical protein
LSLLQKISSTMSSSNIPIVQGVAVTPTSPHSFPQHPHAKTSYQTEQAPIYDAGPFDQGSQLSVPLAGTIPSGNGNFRNGALKQYQDVMWAVLFYVHLFVMIGVLCFSVATTGEANYDGSSGIGSIIVLVVLCSVMAVVLSAMALRAMMNNTVSFVQTALIFSIGTSLAMGIFGFMIANLLIGILGIISFAIGCCYAYVGTSTMQPR